MDKELERWLDEAFKEMEPRIVKMTAIPKKSAEKTQRPAIPSPAHVEEETIGEDRDRESRETDQ